MQLSALFQLYFLSILLQWRKKSVKKQNRNVSCIEIPGVFGSMLLFFVLVHFCEQVHCSEKVVVLLQDVCTVLFCNPSSKNSSEIRYGEMYIHFSWSYFNVCLYHIEDLNDLFCTPWQTLVTIKACYVFTSSARSFDGHRSISIITLLQTMSVSNHRASMIAWKLLQLHRQAVVKLLHGRSVSDSNVHVIHVLN